MTERRDSGQEGPGAESQSSKLISGLGLKTRLAAGCVAVLASGALLAPRTIREAPPSEEQAAAPILQADAERREPARVFRAIQQTGRRVAAFSVAFRPPAAAGARSFADFSQPSAQLRPGGFGIAVSPDRVLTHVAALGGLSEPPLRLPDGGEVRARVVGYEGETGLVLLRVESAALLQPASLAVAPPVPGELALAAARDEGGDVVAPVFIASRAPGRHAITTASGLLMPGTPIYNLAGEALAVSAGSPTATVAYPVADALERLRRLADAGRGLPRSIGVFFQSITPALARIFGEGGVLVSHVADGSPAARAGLEAGDVIVGVAGADVGGVEDALARIAALPADVPAAIEVRRRGRTSEYRVSSQAILAPHLPLRSPPVPADAPVAVDTLSREAFARSGIPDDAIVLQVQGAPVTARTVKPALRRAKPPVLVRLQHGPRRFFAVLETVP
jgi:S1-C subfamily serine protease